MVLGDGYSKRPLWNNGSNFARGVSCLKRSGPIVELESASESRRAANNGRRQTLGRPCLDHALRSHIDDRPAYPEPDRSLHLMTETIIYLLAKHLSSSRMQCHTIPGHVKKPLTICTRLLLKPEVPSSQGRIEEVWRKAAPPPGSAPVGRKIAM